MMPNRSPNLKQIERILLVVRAGSLGDFILTLPAMRALRLRYPEAYLEFMPQTSMLDLTLDTCANHISTPKDHLGMELLFSQDSCLSAEIAEYFSSFDLIIWYGYDPGGVVSINLRRTGCGSVLVASPMPPQGASVHATNYVLSTLKPFGILVQNAEPEIKISAAAWKEAAQLLSKYSSSGLFAVHPGSSSPLKNWAPARFAEFIRNITAQKNLKPLLIAGPSDEESVRDVRDSIAGLDALVLNLPLSLLAAVLTQCVLFVGNDSGVAHLAAAVGTPTVAIFGPTDPTLWAPRGKYVLIVQNHDSLNLIGVEDVVEAANSLLQKFEINRREPFIC